MHRIIWLIEGEELKVEEILKGVIVVMLLLSLVVAPLFLVLGPGTMILGFLTGLLGLGSLGLWYLANHGFFQEVKVGLVILFFLIITGALFAEFGTIRTASTGSYMLVIAMTAVLFLGSKRAIFTVFVASLGAISILYLMERNDPPLGSHSSLGQELLVYFIQYSILTIILYYATYGFVTTMGKLRKLNNELDQEVLKQTQELKEANEQLQEQTKELAQLSEYKSKILEQATHELRTPLTSLSTYLQILSAGRHGPLSDKQKQYLVRCIDETKYLNSLIGDLLNLNLVTRTDLTTGQRFISKDELIWMINLILARYRGTLEIKNLAISVEIDELTFPVHTDPERLRHILAILIDNAFKFTPTGTVNLQISDREETAWQILLTDSGIGIPEDEQERIFEVFHQANNIPQRSRNGLGIGLSLAKQLVELLQGTIRVESHEGQGSQFLVILPRTES